MLDLRGTWPVTLRTLFVAFEKDFIKHRSSHMGKQITYNDIVASDGQGLPEGFWHVVTKKDRATQQRIPDFNRAERLPWARPIMESDDREEILIFEYVEGAKDKGSRRYIWLYEHDYLVILQEKAHSYFWVTAYYIEYPNQRRKYEKRYRDYLKAATASEGGP